MRRARSRLSTPAGDARPAQAPARAAEAAGEDDARVPGKRRLEAAGRDHEAVYPAPVMLGDISGKRERTRLRGRQLAAGAPGWVAERAARGASK